MALYKLGVNNNISTEPDKGGRPPLWVDALALQTQALNYFAAVESENRKVTITGLCYALGFNSRKSFYDYEKKVEFVNVIKRLRLYVESTYEEQLRSTNPTGAIFALKNMGWSDKGGDDKQADSVTWNEVKTYAQSNN